MSNQLKNIVEALLLVSDVPVGISKIQGLFEKGTEPEAKEIKEAISQLQVDCEERSIEVKKIGSGYRMQTRPQYAEWIRKLQAGRPPKLSRAQLETLAIIAYRQPVTRGDIEEIRGVSVSAEIMQRLSERDWIKQIGVRDVPGRPAIFGTTPEFLSYFNLESLSDLPSLMEQREFGDIARDMDINLPPEVLSALSQTEDEKQSDMFEEKGEGEATSEEKVAPIEQAQTKLHQADPNDVDRGEVVESVNDAVADEIAKVDNDQSSDNAALSQAPEQPGALEVESLEYYVTEKDVEKA